ncbi:hypothetical protein HYC85_004417 [Camellia sinensis]|uniref:Uncharacterized protein n=1 Tax=Camellia sinensis TaxID=4442 RepID=A0A7J7HWI0_CAMSI|nr:hypothetical protein HYC85_004417 [Camellia sinensis]
MYIFFEKHKNCLGALDGTYVKVRAPEVGKPRYRIQKGEIATNVLGYYYLVPPNQRTMQKKLEGFGTSVRRISSLGLLKDVFLSDPKWKRDDNQIRPSFYNECEKKILLAFAGTDL